MITEKKQGNFSLFGHIRPNKSRCCWSYRTAPRTSEWRTTNQTGIRVRKSTAKRLHSCVFFLPFGKREKTRQSGNEEWRDLEDVRRKQRSHSRGAAAAAAAAIQHISNTRTASLNIVIVVSLLNVLNYRTEIQYWVKQNASLFLPKTEYPTSAIWWAYLELRPVYCGTYPNPNNSSTNSTNNTDETTKN